MKTKEFTHKDLAVFIFQKFKPAIFHDPMIYKIIPHEALRNFDIDDMTDADISFVRDILIAIDNIDGKGSYDF